MPTRIYYVSQGGYDTHINQAPAQQRLLKELGDSVQAFVTDLKAQNNLSRVLVMTFSEFGRRVEENANGGTDHGAAAPIFIVGDKVKAGLLGSQPSLAPQDLFRRRHQIHRGFPERLCRRAGILVEDEKRTHPRPAISVGTTDLIHMGMENIEHVVVVMMENRSFDNLLGWLYDNQTDPPPFNIPPQSPTTFDGLWPVHTPTR